MKTVAGRLKFGNGCYLFFGKYLAKLLAFRVRQVYTGRMVTQVRSVLSALSDALETACGWALIAAGFSALLFIDVTGGGSLWSALGGLNAHAQAPPESPAAHDTIPTVEKASAVQFQEDRLLVVPDADSTRSQTDVSDLPTDPTVSDLPADPKASESWMRSLQGRLRSFTIYGEGEQTTSAVAQTQGVARPAAAAPAAIVAAPGSAAQAGSAAAVRPGVSSRIRRAVAAQSDSVRNIR